MQIFDPLLKLDADANPQPCLAESWESGDRVVLEAFPDYWRGEAPVKNVYLGAAEPATSIIGPKILYSTEVEKFTQDLDKAKELLKEAGYPYGFETKLWTSDNPARRDMAVIIQDQLKQIGIDVTIETLEWGAYLDGTGRGDQEMYLLGWTTVTRDPDYGIAELTSTETQGNAGNRSFYSNPKLDKLLKAGKIEMDPEKRRAIYKEAQEIIRKDIPMYMILYPTQAVATQKNIKGFKLGTMNSYEIYEVSIEN